MVEREMTSLRCHLLARVSPLNKTLVATLALSLLAGVYGAAASTSYTASGSFVLGDPIGFLILDSCGLPEMEGIGSNCVDLPAGIAGHAYTLDIVDATIVGPVEWSVCYYDAAGAFLGCEVDVVDGTFPAATARYNVNGIGADIRWTITAA